MAKSPLYDRSEKMGGGESEKPSGGTERVTEKERTVEREAPKPETAEEKPSGATDGAEEAAEKKHEEGEDKGIGTMLSGLEALIESHMGEHRDHYGQVKKMHNDMLKRHQKALEQYYAGMGAQGGKAEPAGTPNANPTEKKDA